MNTFVINNYLSYVQNNKNVHIKNKKIKIVTASVNIYRKVKYDLLFSIFHI